MAASSHKKKAAPGKARAVPPKTTPPPPTEPDEQGSWVYTIGFSLSVVSFVIGIYQTIVERDLASNYWLFMISLSFLFGLRWHRLRNKRK